MKPKSQPIEFDVDECVREIVAELEAILPQNQGWLRVADALLNAHNHGVKGTTRLGDLCMRCGFEYSTGTKLIKIARCEWIKQHAHLLRDVDGWGGLHELTKLSNEGRERFRQRMLTNGAPCRITQGLIRTYRDPKQRPGARKEPWLTIREGKSPPSPEDITLLIEAVKEIEGRTSFGIARSPRLTEFIDTARRSALR